MPPERRQCRTVDRPAHLGMTGGLAHLSRSIIFKLTHCPLTDAGGNKGKLQLEWENHIASVQFTVK